MAASRMAAARAYLSRHFLHAVAEAPVVHGVVLPEVTGQVRFVDENGHEVTAYRRGRSSWALDHTSQDGGQVLRFYSTRQLVDELNRRRELPVEVTDAVSA